MQRSAFDFITATLWFVLSLIEIALRLTRLVRLYQIRLPEPVDPRDEDYLASVRYSTCLRLGTTVVFLIGATIALFHLEELFSLWRLGILLALFFMILETTSVDRVRRRLGVSSAP